MSKKFFTSDLHFGHQKVSEIRGFDTTEAHDSRVLLTLADALTEHDQLYVLGDLVGRADAWDYALGLMALVPGRKHLILGNHDPAHPAVSKKKHGQYLREALKVFTTVAPFGTVKIGGKREAVLSHFPYRRDRDGTRPRFMQWRLRDEGALLLHGHLHEPVRAFPGQVHVGWDAWKRPVSIEDMSDAIGRADWLRMIRERAEAGETA